MPRCNINLAEGIIWSRWKRLMAYRAVLVYLMVMALLLSLSMVRAAGKLGHGIAFYLQNHAVLQTFAKQRP